MKIKEFILCVNNYIPTLEQVKDKFARLNISIDESRAVSHLRSQEICHFSNKEKVADQDLLYDLIEGTNIGMVGIGSINFYASMEVNESNNFLEFASINDCYRICMSSESLNIFYYEDESGDQEIITSQIHDFFEFLCEYNKYHKNLTYGVDYDKVAFKKKLQYLIGKGFSKSFIDYLIQS